MNLLALLLCLLGLWISVYFTGVSYHWISPNVKWIPRFCQLKEATCQLVIETPRAKLFGIPNSVYGIGLYTYLIFFFLKRGLAPALPAGRPFGFPDLPLPWFLGFLGALLALIRSVYLAYSLLFVTRIPCPLCFTTHGINLFLFIYLWVSR